MSDINSKLEYLEKTKNKIKDTIESRGVNIPQQTPFKDYANLILAIKGGVLTQEEVDKILLLLREINGEDLSIK